MTRLSDEEILIKCYRYATDVKMLDYIMPDVRTASLVAWKRAEDHFIPQIEKLEESNQANIRALRTQAQEIEKLQGEIESLSKSNREIERLNTLLENEKATSRAFERGFDGMKEMFLILHSKHERLVKASKELIDTVDMDYKNTDDGKYYEMDMKRFPLSGSVVKELIKFCNNALTEEGNV